MQDQESNKREHCTTNDQAQFYKIFIKIMKKQQELTEFIIEQANDILEKIQNDKVTLQKIDEMIGEYEAGLYIEEDKDDTRVGQSISKSQFIDIAADEVFTEEYRFESDNEKLNEQINSLTHDNIRGLVKERF